jgi:parallel beta-helix repeat protein
MQTPTSAAASFKNSQIEKGATYWASPTATATSCVNSATDPGPSGYSELYAATTCLSSGDTLILKPGVYDKYFYNSAIATGTPSQYTTIRGELNDKTSTVLRPGSYHFVIYFGLASHRYIEFANMTIDGTNVDGPTIKVSDENFKPASPCPDCGPHHVRFRNVLIDSGTNDTAFAMGATKIGILGGGPGLELLNSEIRNSVYGLYWTGSGAVVERNWFHNNPGYAVHFYCNGCAYPVSDNIVRFNLFENNATSDPFCSNTLIFASGQNNIAHNNIIKSAGPGACGGGIQLSNGGDNSKIYDNTVYNTAGGIYMAKTEGHVIRNNILWNNVYRGQGRDFFNDPEGPATFTQSNNLCATGNVSCALTINPQFGAGDLPH